MKYYYSKDIKKDFLSTEILVKDALMNIGFGVLTEINMRDAFKSKLDMEYKNYKILGACNPKLAHQALQDEKMIGILMPCNILVIDNEDNTSKIAFPIAKSQLKLTENQDSIKYQRK